MRQLVQAFANDPGVLGLSALVALDFILGVCAGIVKRRFRLAFVADFLRNDVLGKLVPYFAVWAVVHVGGDLQIDGYGAIEEGTLALALAAVGASAAGSLHELGLLKGLPATIVGGERPPAP